MAKRPRRKLLPLPEPFFDSASDSSAPEGTTLAAVGGTEGGGVSRDVPPSSRSAGHSRVVGKGARRVHRGADMLCTLIDFLELQVPCAVQQCRDRASLGSWRKRIVCWDA